MFAYRIGHREHPVPQGQVRGAQGVLYLFRDGHQYQEPIGQLNGGALRGHRKDRPPVHAQGKGGDGLQREPPDGRYGARGRVRPGRGREGEDRPKLRCQEKEGGHRGTAYPGGKGEAYVRHAHRGLLGKVAPVYLRQQHQQGGEGHHRQVERAPANSEGL